MGYRGKRHESALAQDRHDWLDWWIVNAVWSMDVTKAGDFILVATGTPPCQKANPPCLTPTVHYRFTLHAT